MGLRTNRFIFRPTFAGLELQAADKADGRGCGRECNHAPCQELLAESADVNAAQVDGMMVLHWAVYNDDARRRAGLRRDCALNVNATIRTASLRCPLLTNGTRPW